MKLAMGLCILQQPFGQRRYSIWYGVMMMLVFAVSVSPVVEAGHIHELHPSTVHDGNFKRIALNSFTAPPPVPTTTSKWIVVADETLTNGSCLEQSLTFEVNETVTHTLTVGATIEVGGSVEASVNAAVAEVKEEAHCQVTLSGEWSGTYEERISHSIPTNVSRCKKLRMVYKKRQVTSSMTYPAYDHEIICQCTTCNQTFKNYCNPTTVSVSATGYAEGDTQWFPEEPVTPCNCDDAVSTVEPEAVSTIESTQSILENSGGSSTQSPGGEPDAAPILPDGWKEITPPAVSIIFP